FAWAEDRCQSLGGLKLPLGSMDISAADVNGACPAVVGDGQMQPVWHERIFGATQPGANIAGMFAGGVEVGVVANLCRQQQSHFGHGKNDALAEPGVIT